MSAQHSNALTNDVEFWRWLSRNYSKSGIFDSPSSMLDYISQGSTKEAWLSRTVQGKGYEWDYMAGRRGSVRNMLDVFEAGEVQRRGYETEAFQDSGTIRRSRDERIDSIKRGEVRTSYTLKSTAGLMAKSGLIGCAIGVTVEALASYRAWKNGSLSDDEYLAEILKAGGNAGLTSAGTAGIMLPVSSMITAAGMSSLITIPVAFVVGSAVDKIIAPCFGRGEYRRILSQAKYYQNLESLYHDMVGSMQVSSEHFVSFLNRVKSQRQFHENAKQVSMSLNKDLEAMNDNDSKVAQLESQNWFQWMCRTITGKNKATQAEIQRNHDRINAYMSEAISELYNRNLIDHEIILSLGTQINELYADHIQLKQMLGAFAAKLNEKIESVDNFHMLRKKSLRAFTAQAVRWLRYAR